jgi:hypothetical protein
MAISADAAQALAHTLSLTSGDMAYLLGKAMAEGKATGYTDVEGSPMCGVLVTVHHAGDRKFMIELH